MILFLVLFDLWFSDLLLCACCLDCWFCLVVWLIYVWFAGYCGCWLLTGFGLLVLLCFGSVFGG